MQVTVEFLDAPGLGPVTAHGRDAWALLELYRAGDAGCTPITHPGPRWSAYVLKLRKRGLQIETVSERHSGPFAGNHARYVLRSRIEVIAKDSGEVAP
jgi:hypothetical protein